MKDVFPKYYDVEEPSGLQDVSVPVAPLDQAISSGN